MHYLSPQTKAANTSSTSPSGSEASKAPEGGGGSNRSQGETAEPCASHHTSSSPSEAGADEVKLESEGAKATQEESLQDQKTPVAEASGGNASSFCMQYLIKKQRSILGNYH